MAELMFEDGGQTAGRQPWASPASGVNGAQAAGNGGARTAGKRFLANGAAGKKTK
jgi:hypothetical protein